MSKKVALIVGDTGEDGGCLAELLQKKGYIVREIKRRNFLFFAYCIDYFFQELPIKNYYFIVHYGEIFHKLYLHSENTTG